MWNLTNTASQSYQLFTVDSSVNIHYNWHVFDALFLWKSPCRDMKKNKSKVGKIEHETAFLKIHSLHSSVFSTNLGSRTWKWTWHIRYAILIPVFHYLLLLYK